MPNVSIAKYVQDVVSIRDADYADRSWQIPTYVIKNYYLDQKQHYRKMWFVLFLFVFL